jgi:hypothetical protein
MYDSLLKLGARLLGKWHPDLKTAVITVVLVPVGLLILRTVARLLKLWTAFLLEGALYWISRFVIRSLAARLTLRRYCRLLLKGDNGTLYVPSRSDIKLNVDDIFITLQLERHGAQVQTYTHRDLLTIGNRLRIMGDPGSGKTSLSRRIFRDECTRGVSKPRRSRLPVLLELKTLKPPTTTKEADLGEWLYRHIRAIVSSVQVYKMQECFDVYATTNGLLLLLDGLDEVSKQQYPRVRAAIEGLSRKLTGASEHNILLLTMRTQFFHQVKDDFRDTIGHALFVRPFTPTNIYEFLSRWPFKANDEGIVARIYADLTDRPTLREMCTNPLVLSMYVADLESSGSAFTPESRTDFYRRVSEELIVKRRLHQTGKAPAHGKLQEQRERILGRLAYDHLLDASQPSNSLRWSDAMRITREVMKCSDEAATVTFRDIEKETGIITEERKGESLRFIHLTFCEFLAAFEAINGQKDGWGTLIRVHQTFQKDGNTQIHSRLLEVIPFSAGLSTRIRRTVVMTDVSKLGNPRLLARCFLETKAYEHESWHDFFTSTQEQLLATPQDSWNQESLSDLHLLNVVVRDQQQCATYVPSMPVIDLTAFYQRLIVGQKNSLATLLSAYALQDAAAAFRLADACGLDMLGVFPEVVISNCDQPPFLELVIAKVLDDERQSAAWAALLAEAGLQSRVVARTLHTFTPNEKLKQKIEVIPRRQRWNRGSLNTLYTQLLTLAINHDKIDACRAVQILKNVSPRFIGLPSSVLASIAPTIMVALGSAALNHPPYLHYTGPAEKRIQNLLFGLSVVPCYLWLFLVQANQLFFREALNLRRPSLVPGQAVDTRTISAFLTSSFTEGGARLVLSRKRRAILFSLVNMREENSAK